jgi:asparagine synthase (glutamine-hydrolysing)
MCGITLISCKNNQYQSKKYIKSFTEQLRHRGPDGLNFYNDDEINLSLGHTRLKIIDISNLSNQPMQDNNGRFFLSYNGEIYNYLELRKELKEKGYIFKSNSDTEVLLYSFIEWGEKCLFKFNGIWAFAIYDKLKKEIFISRDRFGVKPIYYYFDDNNFIISSEIKAFKVLKNELTIGINLQEIRKLRQGTISRKTIIKNVKSLLPGECISYNFKILKIFRWWNTYENLSHDINSKDYFAYFQHIYRESCKLRLRSDVPITTSLSGGLDSSSIVAEINQDYNNIKKHVSFFLNYDYLHNEKVYVEALKDMYNLDIRQYEFSDKDFSYKNILSATLAQEIIGDDALGPWTIYKNINSEGFKVSIDGHGPDELMGGYDHYKDHFRDFEFFKSTKKNLSNLFNKNKKNEEDNYFDNYDILSNYEETENFEIPKEIKGIDRSLYYDFHYGSLPIILNKFDKISMSHSVESREPFLDWNLVTFLFSLPSKYKIDKSDSKIILRKSMINKLPKLILNRKVKMGFNEDNNNFNKRFKKLIKSIIFSKNFKEDELFNYKKITKDISDDVINYKKFYRYIQAFFLKNYIL